jgi:hypothetical protein
MRKPLSILLLLLPAAHFLFAQNTGPSPQRLKVFIDCSNTWCDMSFIKTEINIVDFLLDNQAADLHVLITAQSTGGGGSRYQMIFFGQNQYKNQTDTLRFLTNPNATEFESRDILIQYLKLGLAPFIAKSFGAESISISMKQDISDKEKPATAQTKDPWNYWVFRIGASGNLNADAVYSSLRYSSSFSASRVTEELKTGFDVYVSRNKSTYEYETTNGTEKFTVNNHDYNLGHYLVKSINQHWSWGYEANLSNSTFSNNKNRLLFRTGAEYNFFPYKDVNNKLLTVSYTFDIRRNRYYDTTLYDKLRETLTGHELKVNVSYNQKWGTASAGISYHNYFHNWKYYNLGLYSFTNVRISGGLSFHVSIFGGLTRDQIFLPKGDATEQEVLTRRRQLASSYNFYSSFGLNYRFGSKLSNFVNPRFSGGGEIIFF